MIVNTIVDKINTKTDIHYSRICAVSSVQVGLGAYIKKKRNDLDLTVAEVSKRSGGLISPAYVSKLENEPDVSPSIEKIQALAKGLGVTEYEILEVAGITSQTELLKKTPAFLSGYDDLTDEDKDELQPTLVMLGNEIARRLLKRRKK